MRLTLHRLAKLLRILRCRHLAATALKHRVFAGVEHRPVLSRAYATIVDIGANRGQFALAARQWCPNARIHAFEPLPGPAALFRRVFADDAQTVLYEAAVGPESNTATMHISARDDSSSLLPITARQSDTFPGTQETATTRVQVVTLDVALSAEDLTSPAMLKLDVQGFELDALRGCESLLHRFDRVYCECSFVELYAGQALASDVIEWLARHGFRLMGIFNAAYEASGQAVQADFLFERMDLVA